MNWLLYGTIGILAVGVIVGYMKGALRIALSLAAAVATWILVVILTPYAADAVIQYTPVDDWIEERCESVLTANMTEALREQTGIETQANGEENLDLSDLMDRLSDIEVSRQEQAEIIENSNIPEIFKEYLQENNNKEIYGMIGANSFADYIAKGITHLVVQILTAIVLFLVISIVLKNNDLHPGCCIVASDYWWDQPGSRSSPWVCNGVDFGLDRLSDFYDALYDTGRTGNFQTDQWKRFPAIFVPEQLYIEDSYGASLIREASFINFLKYSCIKGRQLDII